MIEEMSFDYTPVNPSYDGDIRKIDIIAKGKYYNYRFYVVDYGSHPCCYIAIGKRHPMLKGVKEFWDLNSIDCHGGVTFMGKHPDIDNGKYHLIGWDYSHCNDFYASKLVDDTMFIGYHKYTIDELLNDVKNVIVQIVEQYG